MTTAAEWGNLFGLTVFLLALTGAVLHALGPGRIMATALTSFLAVLWPACAAWSTLRHAWQEMQLASGQLSAVHTLGNVLWYRASWFQVYLMLELTHVLLYCAKRRRMQSQVRPPSASRLTPTERRQLMDRALAACPDDRGNWLSGWFQGAPCMRGLLGTQIWRGNAEEWLAWCLFGKKQESLSTAEALELADLMRRAEQWGLGPFPSGYNERLRGRAMRLTLEAVGGWPRPLFLYALVAVAHSVAAALLRHRHGFERRSVYVDIPGEGEGTGYLHYWYRCAAPEAYSMQLPAMVLLHGIGPGASLVGLMSVGRLQHVGLQQCAIIVPELPELTYCLGLPPLPAALTPRQTAAAIAMAVSRAHDDTAAVAQARYHDDESSESNEGGASKNHGAVCIGQSFGTVVLSWLLKYQPQTVSAALLIDPVVFLIHHAALCYRFLYRRPVTVQQQLLRYFAADELHIQHYLRRHFEWHENALWLEDIPPRLLEKYENGYRRRVCVVVGEADSFIDAPAVIKYLKQPRTFIDNNGALEQDGAADNRLSPDLFTVEGADHGGWAASGQVGNVIAWVLSLPELRQASRLQAENTSEGSAEATYASRGADVA